MSRITCIADRFAMTDRTHAIDLATGDRVTMIVSRASAHDEHARWVARCDSQYQCCAFNADNLVDFGRCGESHRFEAWQDRSGVHRTVDRIAGIRHVERAMERALAELFEYAELRSRTVCVFGPRGSGKTRLLSRMARSARVHGFVPLAADLLESPLSVAIEGRSVCLIDDERGISASALAHLVLRSPRPHVILRASLEDTAGLAGVAVKKLSTTALMSAVVPEGAVSDAALRRAAERAAGNPGRFVALINPRMAVRESTLDRVEPRRRTVTVISRAAEQSPIYGATAPAAPWPVPAEVTALRRQVHEGMRHLDDGRHAPGERELRQAIGGLTRRGEWTEAAEGSLALAASLLKRGRPQDAKAVIDAARDACRRAAGERLVISAATLAGTASIDLGRLDEAETVLSAAQTVAAHGDDRGSLVSVSIALARARFWRGRYADAQEALRPLVNDVAEPAADLEPAARVRVDVMRSRIAVTLDDVAAAVTISAAAVERADGLARFDLVALATCAAAFAHLAAGDLAAVRRDVAACSAAARATRDPLRRVRAELLLCEHLRRAGLFDEARRMFVPLRRMPASTLPRVVRCRRDLLAELLTPGAQPTEAVARQISSTGFQALALFASKEVRKTHRERTSAPVEDAISILRICQTAADETTTLTQVCEQVQRQTDAAAAAFFGVEAGGLARLASHGRIESGAAQRAVEAGVFIAPHQIDERVEAAAPVKYGGAIVGALAMRWIISSAPNHERVAAVADMAIAAAAPVIAAALSARRRSETTVFNELLGVSETMIEVRRAVERAASAPFAVLIEGAIRR